MSKKTKRVTWNNVGRRVTIRIDSVAHVMFYRDYDTRAHSWVEPELSKYFIQIDSLVLTYRERELFEEMSNTVAAALSYQE